MSRVFVMNVDEVKAAMGIPYEVRLRPTLADCLECGEWARMAAGDHVCLWCRATERFGCSVVPEIP